MTAQEIKLLELQKQAKLAHFYGFKLTAEKVKKEIEKLKKLEL